MSPCMIALNAVAVIVQEYLQEMHAVLICVQSQKLQGQQPGRWTGKWDATTMAGAASLAAICWLHLQAPLWQQLA